MNGLPQERSKFGLSKCVRNSELNLVLVRNSDELKHTQNITEVFSFQHFQNSLALLVQYC